MATFEHNKDGSAVVKLDAPIIVRGEELSRVTIPALRGRHMRHSPITLGDLQEQKSLTIGRLVEFAALVVEPSGAVDEMIPTDARDVALEVTSMLGKSPKTGEAGSPL